MQLIIRSALAGALTLGAAAAGHAAAPEKAPIAVTNTQTQRAAHCTVLVDGRTDVKLAIRPGKTWSAPFDPRREVLLICDRATSVKFGPLKAGSSYRLVEAHG